jgi:deoxyguanosine kinase
MKIISIEGNIGSGKSTFVEKLKKEFWGEITFLSEPVDIWNTIQDSSGVTILEKYYSDQTKYAFSFQMMAYITRLQQLKEALASGATTIVMERSLYTDRHIFAAMLYETGKMEEIEYRIYLKWFDEFMKEIPEITFVYLDISPDICLERIHTRNRKGEESITIEYLKETKNFHDRWLKPTPFYMTDTDIDTFKKFVTIP